MTREEYLRQIAREYYDANGEKNNAEKRRTELRDEFFRLADEEFRGRDHILPVRTIDVPESFFTITGMSYKTFMDSRFPGWTCEHVEKNIQTGVTTFVVKKNPAYMTTVIDLPDDEDHVIRVAKEVSEYTPEVDWDTLKAERPDLFDKLAKPVEMFELDDAALERISNETPEELATLERHLRTKAPVKKATAKRVKSE